MILRSVNEWSKHKADHFAETTGEYHEIQAI